MNARPLLGAGVAMPFVYLAMFALASSLSPDHAPLAQPPSELGRADVPYAYIFNTGMVGTALAGAAGALGLLLGLRQVGSGLARAVLTALSLALASIGLAMAGLFPLPDSRHYGFGLTMAAALLPLLGAAALWRRGASRRDSTTLLVLFVMTIGLAVTSAAPLVVGTAMLAAVAYLCWAVIARLQLRQPARA